MLKDADSPSRTVIARLDRAISMRRRPSQLDAPVKPGHDMGSGHRASVRSTISPQSDGGPARAERYIGAIRARCEALARGEAQGRDADHIRPGYRRLEVASHVIFYRIAGGDIEVIRILHARMDFGRHL